MLFNTVIRACWVLKNHVVYVAFICSYKISLELFESILLLVLLFITVKQTF